MDGHAVQIDGTFRHRNCLRVSTTNEPWASLTCCMCAIILCLIDFRLRVMKEDKCVEKQGTRSIGGGK